MGHCPLKGLIECYCGGLMLQTVCITIHSCSGNFWSGLDIPLQFSGDPEAVQKIWTTQESGPGGSIF